MRHVFIVNPCSGYGKTIPMIQAIKEICNKEELDYQVIYTKKEKDAVDIARIYAKEDVVLYSVGGDGTLFEVLNGMADTPSYLNVIPAGTGNDFYKTVKDIEKPFQKIDVGKVNDTYFVNSSSIGLDAEIADNVKKFKKWKVPRSMVYHASILYTYFQYRSHEIFYQLDQIKERKNITLCAVCNGKYYGGGFQIAPHASLTDGKLDVYIADQLSKLEVPGLFLKLLKGDHEDSSKVHYHQTTDFTITSSKNLICNVDGEIIQGDCFHFKLLPNHVTYYDGNPKIKQFVKEKVK